jgi:hypothetical protein
MTMVFGNLMTMVFGNIMTVVSGNLMTVVFLRSLGMHSIGKTVFGNLMTVVSGNLITMVFGNLMTMVFGNFMAERNAGRRSVSNNILGTLCLATNSNHTIMHNITRMGTTAAVIPTLSRAVFPRPHTLDLELNARADNNSRDHTAARKLKHRIKSIPMKSARTQIVTRML